MTKELTVKQPIEPSDIRVGDLVRVENPGNERASEWRVAKDSLPTPTPGTNWFLLDRPQPAPSKKAMVAAQVLNIASHLPHTVKEFARRIDEAWAKEGLGE